MTQPPVAAACYRHPNVATYIACQRCGRPICGDCMISAAVGFQCPECVRQGAKQTRQNRGPYGGTRSANPAVTSLVLIATNIAVWASIMLTGGASSWLVNKLALTAGGYCAVVGDSSQYYPDVSKAACDSQSSGIWLAQGVASGEWWQLITSAFTHIEFLHLAMNMVGLWFLGPMLEQVLGRVRFLAVYLLSALAGSATVMWLSDSTATTLGASGAIFGLIGALLVLVFKTGGDLRTVLIWLGLNLVFTFLGPGISWQGHIGGLVGGLATVAIIVFAPAKTRTAVQVGGLTLFALVMIAVIGARALQLG